MSEELKPCPFCGSEIDIIPAHFDSQWCINVPSIICKKCHKTYEGYDIMQIGKSDVQNEKFATDMLAKWWNTRPAEDVLKVEVERLKAKLDAQKSVSKIAYHDIKRLCEELDMYKKMYFDLSGKKGGEDE